MSSLEILLEKSAISFWHESRMPACPEILDFSILPHRHHFRLDLSKVLGVYENGVIFVGGSVDLGTIAPFILIPTKLIECLPILFGQI